MKLFMDSHTMKIHVIVLFVLACKCTCQGPIVIKDGQKAGSAIVQFPKCSGGENGTLEAVNFNDSLFKTVDNGSTIAVILARDVNLKTDTGFKNVGGPDTCIKKVDLFGRQLKFHCKNENSERDIILELKSNQITTPHLCHKNCTRITNPLNLTVSESTPVGNTLLSFSFCDDKVYSASPSSLSMQISGDILEERSRKSLFLNKELDYENQPHNLTSIVSINGKYALTINIEIEDADDQGIAFNKNVFNCSIPENKGQYVTECKVHANDLDTGINEEINYKLLSVTPPTDQLFQILPNGSLKLLNTLDREKVAVYYLGIKGFQRNDYTRENFTNMKINVVDVDDNLPEMMQPQYNVSVMENSPPGTFVCKVSASDKDIGENGAFRYMIDGTSNYFSIDDVTGFVTVKSRIDREKSPSLHFKVFAQAVHNSNRRSNFSTVFVSVLDENDNSPVISTPLVKNISKTRPAGSVLMQINVSDPDEGVNGDVKCSIAPPAVPFAIKTSNKTCVISLKETLNETKQLQYTFDLGVQDMARDIGKRRSTSARVTINIIDENIHTPKFGPFSRLLNVSESADIGTILVALTASDKDPTDKLKFNITSYDELGLDNDNRIYLKKSLDRERNASYNITVTVFDGQHSKSTSIELNVLDVNDNAPIFENSSYTFHTREETDNPHVGRVRATDIDQQNTCNSQIEYFIDKDSPWGSKFTVNKTTGIISAKAIDREKLTDGDKISFSVFAQNCGTPVLASRTFVTITIDDINDNQPKFENTDVKIEVEEETPLDNLTTIYTVQAIDKDKGKNAEIVYHLQDGGKSLVSIDSKTGILRMLKVPLINDGCTNQSFSFNVTAVNKVPYVNAEDTQPLKVTIVIKDINNHSPEFELRHFNLPPKELGYMYHILSSHPTAKDADCEPYFNNITFHLADGSDERLGMNESTGQFYFKSQINYSFPKCDRHINLNMYGTDGWRKTYKNTTLPLVVSASPAVPVQEQYTFRVTEGKIYNTSYTVGFLDCNDIDLKLHINDTHFDIQQNGKNGTLVVKHALDYETEKIIWTRVTANTTRSTSSCIVKIVVEDINDESPQFTNSTYTFTIKENIQIGTIIGTVSATDIDTNSTLTYGIVGLPGNTYLNLESDGTLTSTKPFDLEEKDANFPLTANISVSDGKHKTFGTVVINVEHVNEFPPDFEAENFNFSVNENSQRTWNITATDKDVGDDGMIANYSLHVQNKWKGNVSVNKHGQITVKGLDREAMGQNNKIVITVEARDGGQPSRTGITFVSVTVKGINENKPEFPSVKRNVSVYLKESPRRYQNIYQSKAYDSDIGVGSEIFYRLQNGSRIFDINNTTGVIFSKTGLLIDATNNGKFTVIVEAYNKENTAASSMQTIVIYLEDINNKVPVFSNMPRKERLDECTPLGQQVTRVSASDADVSGEYNTVTYWSEQYNDLFHIDSSTGIIYLVDNLDVDSPSSRSSYNITIYATDNLKYRNKSSDHTVQSTLLLEVLDCNDNAPVFTKDVYFCAIRENQKGSFKCDVEALDKDKTPNNITYMLSNNLQKKFTINSTTGNLSIQTPFDFESVGNRAFILNVSAYDEKFRVYSSVSVNIINVNDETPRFSKKTFTFRIAESNSTQLIVGQISASDEDGNLNKLQYTLNQTNVFDIGDDGYIITTEALDYELQSVFNVTAIVNDSQNIDTATVLIHILPVNEYPPVFNSNYTWTITENTNVTKQIQAIDRDSGDDKPITYTADIPTKWTNDISFDKSAGIFTLKNIDREALGNNSIIRITAEALDGGTPQRTGVAIIHVTVNGVNDERPIYSPETRNITLHLEEGKNYQNVYTSKAFDADIGVGSIISYRVVKGNDTFRIDKNNGSISTNDRIWINELNNGILVAEIEAYNDDGSAMKDIQYITVILQDINNNKPTFVENRYTVKVDECTSPGTNILRVNATDADTTTQFNTVDYWLQDYKQTFSVDHSTGDLFLVGRLDCDSQDSITNYTFKIYATDDIRLKNESIFTTIEVDVYNCNDNAPLFTKDFYKCEVEENKTGQINCPLLATDLDGDILVYETMNSTQSQHFHISSNDGKLSVVLPFNFEDMDDKKVLLNVSASDKNHTRFSSVTVNVINVNDEIPHFSKKIYHFRIAESNRTSLLVGQISASDKDGDLNKLQYTLIDTHVFDIGDDGYLTTKHALNYELQSEYNLTAIVNDSRNVDAATVLIHVLPANEFPPVFKSSYTWSISENTNVTKQIQATDKDRGDNKPITYRAHIPAKWAKNILFDRASGNFTLTQIDREALGKSSIIRITAEAIDGGTSQRTGLTLIQVTVKGVNDERPIYPTETRNVTLHLREGRIYQNVYTSKASDADIGVGSIISYRLVKGNDTFSIDKDTGSLSTNDKIWIHESNKGLLMAEIEAFNDDGSGMKDTQFITIMLQDINNNKPTFVTNRYIEKVDECTSPGTKILRVNATDADTTTQFNTVTYWLQDYNKTFYVDYTTGDLFLDGPLDYDSPDSVTNFTFKVYATDDIHLKDKSIFTTVEVTVTNCNDNAPVFTQDMYKCQIKENEKGQINCPLLATDLDGDNLTYAIIKSPQTQHFNISPNGTLSVVKPFNFEDMNDKEVLLNVSVSDTKHTRFSSVAVNVANINDETPQFSKKIYNFSIAESNRTKLLVGQISASDKDGDLNILQFTLHDSHVSVFDIGDDGYITTKHAIDYELQSEYNLTATVNDSKNVDTATVLIHVLPANEFPPVFYSSYSWTITENTNVTKQIQATDKDRGDNKPITYKALIPVKWTNNISFDSTSGNITLTQIDREALGNSSFIRITAEALDGGTSQRTGLTLIKVIVKGVNDERPIYPTEIRNVTLHLEEGRTYQNVYTSKAFDADIGVGSIVSYRLVKGNDTFSIDKDTGSISTKVKVWITKSNNGILMAEIEAYNDDGSAMKDTQYITVILQDINNNKPNFVANRYIEIVDECTSPGTKILRVNATDADTTTQFNTVTYWLEDYNNIFYVDHSTGDLLLVGPLDYDSPDSVTNFTFKVYATDDIQLKDKSVFTTIEVTVTNCNDNAPVFTQDLYKCKIQENEKGQFNCSMLATDLDGDMLTYAIIKSPQTQHFNISPNGTLFVVMPFNFEDMVDKEVLLNVSVTDTKHTRFSSVKVNLINVNDETPQFSNDTYVFSIAESNKTKLIVGQISATDKDGDLNKLQYTLHDSHDLFDIDDIGYITTKDAIDYELQSEYKLKAFVDDSQHVAITSVLIHILPVNEYPPVFNGIYKWNISENTNVTKQIQAIDKDRGDSKPITYRADIPANWTKHISFDSGSGIFTLTQIDREALGNNSIIRITTKAIDGGTPQRTGLTIIHVTVKGVNDERPIYPPDTRTVTFHLKEGKKYQHVYTSKAFDADIGAGSIISYRLIKGNDTFSINKNNGTISTKDVIWINEKNNGILMVEIEAFNDDGSDMKDIQFITIILQGINNNRPVFEADRYTEKVDECTNPGTAILRVNATDADTTAQFNTVNYWSQDYNDTFYVDRRTGNLYLVGLLDFDALGSITNYTFMVYATDDIRQKNESIFTTIEIDVSNCDD